MTVRNHFGIAVAAGVLAGSVAVACAATATADPAPPAPAEPPPAPTGFLPPAGQLQSFLPEGGLAASPGYDFLLGQSPTPAPTGGQADQGAPAGTLLDPQAIQALRPTNFTLAGQGEQSMYSYTPAAPDAPPGGFLDNARGAHGLWNYQMGKLDPSQLGEPLPGTAPPPGTNLPTGIVDVLPDPAGTPPPAG